VVSNRGSRSVGFLFFFAQAALVAACSKAPVPSPSKTEVVEAALNASPKTSDFIFEAANSIVLHSAPLTVNGGDLGARGTGSGPFLSGSVAIDISSGAVVQSTHNTIADSIRLNTGIKVGDLQVNRLVNPSAGTHGSVTPLVPLPALPAPATVTPGTTNLTVAGGKTVTVSPGQFLTVSLGTSSVLRLNAGTYQLKDLTIGTSGRVEALGPVQIRIANRLNAGSSFFIGPAATATTLTAKDIRIEVSGVNGTDGAIGSSPKAAALGSNGSIRALVLVPNGTLTFATGICAKGAFLARDIDVGSSKAAYTFEDGFPNAGSTCTPASCDDHNPCTTDVCAANGTCTHTNVGAGTSCSDGNACNGLETCNGSGACQPGTPVTCTPSDQCHTAGTCDTTTGACTNPVAANGTTCNDGDSCTRTDTCQAGVCTGSDPVVCTASDQCHDAGTCDKTTGVCSNPGKPDGTACNDNNACTLTDACQAGACTGSNPVLCAASDQCHDAGMCDSTTGLCPNPAKPNGAPCNDGNACTLTDTCQAGTCTGSNPVLCTASDQCHDAGACNATTGICSNPAKPNGAPCSDGNACTLTDTCQTGTCTGSNPVVCTASDQCHAVGSCNTTTGACSNPTKPDGTACNDNSACTQTDTCQTGACTGSNPVTCTALDACHDVGTCASDSGQCSNPLRPAGTPCGSGNACTADGLCVPTNQAPVVNAGPDQTADLQQGKPGPTFTLQRLSTTFNAPVGIEYHPILNKMVMSVNCCGGQPHNFDAVNPDGTHEPFSTISGLTDEVYFAIARDEGGGHNIGGFVAGEMYVGTGVPGNIARVSPDGSTIQNPWLVLPGEPGLLRGQLQFDRTGGFGGDLLVTTTAGHLWRVNAAGEPTLIASNIPGGDVEGLTAVPNDPDRYGPWAGKILVGDEGVDAINAIDASGNMTSYQLGVRPENIHVVPAGENFFGVDYYGGALYGASASQFKDMIGDIIVTEESGGTVWHFHWNGTTFVKTLLAQVVLWEHTTFGPAAMSEIDQSNVQVALSGTATDDGKPDGSTLSATWAVVSGPGPVTFGDLHAPSTTATFIDVGTYVLALTATDGALTTTDQVTITVRRITPNNQAPTVDAGPDQTIRLPAFATLAGVASDDGVPIGSAIALSWSEVSGPADVTFVNPNAGLSSVLFTAPGTYVLQLTATDGELSSSDQVTIVVQPQPSLDGASLAIALANAGPLQVGDLESVTATLTDINGQPMSSFPIRLTVTGANALSQTLDSDAAGTVTFVYTGNHAGTDTMHATALGLDTNVDSASVSVAWVDVPVGGPVEPQGWIASPLDQSSIKNQVPIVLSPDVTLTSGTLLYWPAATPSEVHTLATGLSGGPGATLATLDTTTLANDVYVVLLEGTNAANEQKSSAVMLTVTGEYKPGRVVFETTDLTVPVAGLPITIGRRYDSLEKDKIGDFGYGWSLAIGHPRLEVAQNFTVSLTLPEGKRASFRIALTPPPINFFGVFYVSYEAEPGVYGTLTQTGGCPLVRPSPGNPDGPIRCFGFNIITKYEPELYTYTDPNGTAYVMKPTGELTSITDRQGNKLTFQPDGIISSAGKSVTFVRDANSRITKVDYPAYFGATDAGRYTYDAAGDLVSIELPPSGNAPSIYQHSYDRHLLLTSTDARGNVGRTSTYDASGRLATDKDALGNVTSYAYDLPARTTRTTYPDMGVLTQIFDEQGLVVTETNQLGNSTHHEYDENQNETRRVNALNEVTTAVYDAHGNRTSQTTPMGTDSATYNDLSQPISFTDRLGNVGTVDYDPDLHVASRFTDSIGTLYAVTSFNAQGQPLTVIDAAGNPTHFTYDAAGNTTSMTDFLGRVTHATYDEAGHQLTKTSARGNTTTKTYTFQGWLDTITDPNGYGRQNVYDANGNIFSSHDFPTAHGQTNPTYDALNHLIQVSNVNEGTFVNYTRDFRGNPLTMSDENGHVTTYEYDLLGRLTKTTFADGTSTERTYDALGRLATLKDERGGLTAYEYQAGCECSDLITKRTDPLGRVTRATYDPAGRLTARTDTGGKTTTFAYDVRGHLTDVNYADGTTVHRAYDERGRRVSMTDQTGAVTRYGYDDMAQLTSVTDPLGNVTRYAYDLDGNVASLTDPNLHTTSYEYDLMNNRTKRKLPLGQIETFLYDGPGNVTSHTDFRGKTTTMTYNFRDGLLSKVPDSSLGEPEQTFTYSPTGKRLTATNATGTTTYTYDERDRMLSKATPAGRLDYGYDEGGNVTSIRSSNANGTSVDYLWDAASQLVSATDNRAGGATTTVYTPTGQPSLVTQPNGVTATSFYDAVNRVTSMVWKRGAGPAFASWDYTFNPRGQRVTAKDATNRTATYSYDIDGWLKSETISGAAGSGNGAITYALDGAANRLSRTSTLTGVPSAVYSYDANDQLTTDGYDPNGNTTSADGHTYVYDFENRLVSKDGGSVTIAYDCDGNRVAKTVGGVTTQFLVDDQNPTGYAQVLEELVGGSVQTRYTYGAALISQTRNASSAPVISYYGHDAHGNITFMTDASGNPTDSYDYDAWGIRVAQNGSTPNRRLFAGEELDPDLGLIAMRARAYEPTRGRFTTLDPAPGTVGYPITFNRYLFANGDPVNQIDPRGTEAFLEYSQILSFDLSFMGLSGGKFLAKLAKHATIKTIKETAEFYKNIDEWAEYVEPITGIKIEVGVGLTTACELQYVAAGFDYIDSGGQQDIGAPGFCVEENFIPEKPDWAPPLPNIHGSE
jgi:RHS repeat-associated protein